jgi:hypothetical protein
MPVNKFILKNAKRQAAVKLTGTGQATVSIYDFLAVLGPNAITDTQTITPANVQLHIKPKLLTNISSTCCAPAAGWAKSGTPTVVYYAHIWLHMQAKSNIVAT